MALDKGPAISVLKDLRSQIAHLQTQEALGHDFLRWHEQVVTSLASIFGSDSPEIEEFKRIQFELPPDLVDRSGERLRKAVRQLGTAPHADTLEISLAKYHRQRLYEAEEFLSAQIITFGL